MPRVTNTRRHKARELVRLLETGPLLSDMWSEPFTPKYAMDCTKEWIDSWVRPLVDDLVPELKPKSGPVVTSMFTRRKT